MATTSNRSRTCVRAVFGAAILSAALGTSAASPLVIQPKQEPTPQPLPAQVTAAWEKAGAETGWLGRSFIGLYFRKGDTARPGEVPAFLGGLARGPRLPQPQQPFGIALTGGKTAFAEVNEQMFVEMAEFKNLEWLDLGFTTVGNNQLKKVGALKQLRALGLSGNPIGTEGQPFKDDGVKPLAALTGLHTLQIGETRVGDADLKELTALKDLRTLYIYQTPLTDAGLKHLAAFPKLEELHLSRCQRVTEAGLKEVAVLKNLRVLGLTHIRLTGACFKELAPLENLEELNLGQTQLNDAGLKEMTRFKKLKLLNVTYTQLTGDGAKQLAAFKEMEWLDLYGVPITDAGLNDLLALTKLRALGLGRAKVTPAGIKQLARLEHLRELDLRFTFISPDEAAIVNELRKALPKVRIITSGIGILPGKL